MQDYDRICFQLSEQVTRSYSTSFYSATHLLDKESRAAIFSIYGFVRFADEIVDTFHGHDKELLLEKFERDFFDALNTGISLNPVLHAFQITVREYGIAEEHIRAFLSSMKADLDQIEYVDKADIDRYVYGSADVVGLMCMKVFCHGNDNLYAALEKPAMRLGSAFQKVNFLRDLRNDMHLLNRSYFPEITRNNLDEKTKMTVIREMESDFNAAKPGIRKLPGRSRLAVLTAFLYYQSLMKKIRKTPAGRLMETRIRVPDLQKFFLLLKAYLIYIFRLI